MIITTEVLTQWRLLYEHGDIAAIIAKNGTKGFTRFKVRNAINAGRGHYILMDAVSRYFKAKEKEQSKITV